jgi:hypothetical protein
MTPKTGDSLGEKNLCNRARRPRQMGRQQCDQKYFKKNDQKCPKNETTLKKYHNYLIFFFFLKGLSAKVTPFSLDECANL